MSMTINNVVNKYAYTNSKTGQARVNLDTSADGVWSEKEVERYAADYEQATGKKVDVKAVFDRYDSDKSGTLDYSEYDAAIAEDALGIGQLMEMHAAQLAGETATEEPEAVEGESVPAEGEAVEGEAAVEDTGESAASEEAAEAEGAEESEEAEETVEYPTEMAEFMANLTPNQRISLVKATFQAESATNLINSMLNPGAAVSSLNSALANYTNKMAQNALRGFDTLA